MCSLFWKIIVFLRALIFGNVSSCFRTMAVPISEICENTKLAREMALTGNYDTSAVYYQGVVQQIHRLLASIGDATRKAKWQLVQHQIVEEFEKVKATSSTLQLFKVDSHTERALGIIRWFLVCSGCKKFWCIVCLGPSCLSYEEPTRDPTLWSCGNPGSAWSTPVARDPDVWPPLGPLEQK